MNLITLITFSESEKRVIICLCIIILFIVVIIGYLERLVEKVMKLQGKAVDKYMFQIAKADFLSEKEFYKVARTKNKMLFFQQSWLSIVLIFIFGFSVLIYGWSTNDFNMTYVASSFKSLSFELSWPTGNFFGIENFVIGWPTVIKSPNWSWDLGKYLTLLFFLGLTIGSIRFMVNVQALIAREKRIRHLKYDYFGKDLKTLNPDISSLKE